jgi:ArsR family transcriptional regulator, arsenate/arsenite/antimonite-responsive transcriptional repressor
MAELPVIECCTPLAGTSLDDQGAVELEAVLKSLADRHRLRVVNQLLRADGEPVCVCELQSLLGLSQGTVSHHLKQLVAAGIVERESRGTYSYFSLAPGALESVRDVFAVPARVPVSASQKGKPAATGCC